MPARLPTTACCAALMAVLTALYIVTACDGNENDGGETQTVTADDDDSDSAHGDGGAGVSDDRPATATDDDESEPGNDDAPADDSTEPEDDGVLAEAACREEMTSVLPEDNTCEDCVPVECEPDDGSWSAFLFVNQHTNRCCTILSDPDDQCFWTNAPHAASNVCGEWNREGSVPYRSRAVIQNDPAVSAEGCINIDVSATAGGQQCQLCARNDFCWFCMSDADCDCTAFTGYPYDATWCPAKNWRTECEKDAGSSVGLCKMDIRRFP